MVPVFPIERISSLYINFFVPSITLLKGKTPAVTVKKSDRKIEAIKEKIDLLAINLMRLYRLSAYYDLSNKTCFLAVTLWFIVDLIEFCGNFCSFSGIGVGKTLLNTTFWQC
jgi:hypothetical protein